MFADINGIVELINQEQVYRINRNRQHLRLYSNEAFQGLYGVQKPTSQTSAKNTGVTLNVIKSIVDTAESKIAKNKPRPLFLTEKGDYSQQSRAKKLSKYIAGVFESQDMYTKAQQSFKDGEIFGTGCLKFIRNDSTGEIEIERVIIDEIIVDQADGMYGSPQQLFQTKYISRDVLYEMFPKYRTEIKQAEGGVDGDTSSKSSADLVKVTEAWHLKSGGGASDGHHAIVISTATLFEEQYDKEYFPFVFFRWCDKVLGFYGAGIPEEIKGIQIEINKLLRTIQKAMHLMCHPKWLVENSSGVNTQHLNNLDGGVVKFNITPPQAVTPPAMSPEVYQHLENLYNKAFENVGINQLSSTGKKPSGLDAGVAIREYNDIESERFALTAQRYEKMFLDASKIIIDMSRDLHEQDDNDLKVKVKGKKFIETIKWEDVDLEDDKFVMTAFPVSQLPKTPQGRLQHIQELTQAGYIDKAYALDLLDFPDIESYVDNKTASIEILKEIIEGMIEEGRYTSPEPYMDLTYNIEYTQRAYLQAKMNKVPEDKLALLQKFMNQNKAMIEAAELEAAAAIAAQQAQEQPIAVPEQNPTSNLLPLDGV